MISDMATRWCSDPVCGSFNHNLEREEPGLPGSRFPALSAKNEFQEERKVTYQVKLLLQFFISVIDAKLFEAVHIKGFKAEMQLNKLKCNLEDIYIIYWLVFFGQSS